MDTLYQFKRTTYFLAILVHVGFLGLFFITSRAPIIQPMKIRERTFKILPAVLTKESVAKALPKLQEEPKETQKANAQPLKEQAEPKSFNKNVVKSTPVKKNVLVKPSKKILVKKKEIFPKKEIVQHPVHDKNLDKLNELTSTIAKSLEHLKLASPKVLQPLKPLVLKAELTAPMQDQKEQSALEELLSCLRKNLILPEYGSVLMELRIDRDGEISFLKILKSQSEKNSEYLKKTLPSCSFSCLNESIKGQSIHILFTNEAF